MKKLYALLPILAALLVPGKASAQMMPDSTVQIVAYWEVGDKVDYTSLKREYDIDAEGNETQTASSSETVHFEVVAATDTSYTLKVTYDDIFDIRTSEFKLTDKELASLPNPAYLIRTDEFGSFQGIENLEEITAAFQSAAPIFSKVFERSIGNDGKEIIDRLVQEITSPDAITRAVISDITPLLYFHGARIDTTAAYTIEEPVQGLLGASSGPCTMPGSFWVDSELTDEYSAVIRKELHADKEQMGPIMKSILQPMLETISSAFTDGNEEDIEQAIDSYFDEMAQHATFAFEDSSVEEIHLETGWPINWMFDRYVTFSMLGKTEGKHIARQIRLVTEEEE